MPLLEACALTKAFPGVMALREVNFDLAAGEIHALCGENGAGKSTLIKLLSGIHPHGSYEGELRLDGRSVQFRSVHDAESAGIAVITQEFALVPELSVAENIFLGRLPRRCGLVDWPSTHRRTRALLAEFGLEIDPETPVAHLGVGQKQLLEIIRAIDKRTRILVLDEPTAALPERETEILLGHLRRLRTNGTSCIYISHKLEEVFAISDRITVLRDGLTVGTLATRETSVAEVIRRMVGREITDLFPRRPARSGGEPLLTVRDLTVAPTPDAPARLRDISLELRAGEVLGIGGLMGAGRTELLLHLFGAWGHRLSGEVKLRGKPSPATTPGRSIRGGVALVSEDRRRYGLVLEQSIGFNLSLSSLPRFSRHGWLDLVAEHRANQQLFDSLRVRAPGQDAAAGGLSGGNQQKVVIGKALMTDPSVVMLDEPTRGIDVGAKVEVYELINRLTAEGRAVLLVSSELPELMGMSDRIVMLSGGRIARSFERPEFSQEALLTAALGQGAIAA